MATKQCTPETAREKIATRLAELSDAIEDARRMLDDCEVLGEPEREKALCRNTIKRLETQQTLWRARLAAL